MFFCLNSAAFISDPIIQTAIKTTIKEKNDGDSVKTYGTFAVIGGVITIGIIIKIAVAGF